MIANETTNIEFIQQNCKHQYLSSKDNTYSKKAIIDADMKKMIKAKNELTENKYLKQRPATNTV